VQLGNTQLNPVEIGRAALSQLLDIQQKRQKDAY
jgi:hypothetical protein